MFLLFWLILGAIFLLVEVITTSFFVIFFGFAALTLACLVFLFTLSITQQILLFLFFSIFFLFFVKKILRRKKEKSFVFSHDLVGEYGIASEDIHPNGYGKIIIGDTLWKASSKRFIQKGSSVKIISQNNLTLEVQ